MSSMIHGIRVLAKNDRILTFKTYLIYSDWDSLPRTHGFGLLILDDRARETANANSAMAKEIETYDFIDENYSKAREIIVKMEVTNFENIAIKEEFLESTWHYLDEKTGKFHAQEHLPQAVYTLEVSDAKWIEHIHVGDVWETTSCDLDGASWYLEYDDGKSKKFYRVFDKMGWKIVYGKIGTAGREENPYMNFTIAQSKVDEKLRKGYQLIYKNFDTPFGHEEEANREAKQKAKAAAAPQLPEVNDALFAAIDKEDVEALKTILASGVNPNECKDKYGQPALEKVADSWNINENHIAMARLLLDHGADPNLGEHGPFLPSVCYMNRSEEMVRLLIDRGADITLYGGYDDHSVIHSASKNGLVWLVKDAIEKGGDVKHRTKQGHTALHYAAESSQNAVETIDLLLAHGADLHDANGEWGQPLAWAAGRGGKAETVNHLVKLGADVNAETPKGERAIHLAAQYGSADAFRALVENGAEFTKSKDGHEIMHIIAERVLSYNDEIGNEAVQKIEFLRSKGYALDTAGRLLAKIKSASKIGKSELERIYRLLDLGLSPYEADPKGFTLLHFAAKLNHAELLEKCLEKEGNINVQDENGWSALHFAMCHKDKACVQMLIDANIGQELKTKKKYKFLKKDVPSGLTAKEVGKLFGN